MNYYCKKMYEQFIRQFNNNIARNIASLNKFLKERSLK